MRFLPEGPNIPDELLEERDNGNVVFLCGAGVSYPAGMPDFLGLARFVVEELGTPQNAPSRDMLSMWKDETIPAGARPSLDQIFNLLQQEYAAGDVDYLIAKKLKTPRGANLSAHKTILSLSRSSNGEPQIVTTNFDLLFEKAAQRKLKTHVAPALPDLAGMRSFDGIVYLHGRIDYRINRRRRSPKCSSSAVPISGGRTSRRVGPRASFATCSTSISSYCLGIPPMIHR